MAACAGRNYGDEAGDRVLDVAAAKVRQLSAQKPMYLKSGPILQAASWLDVCVDLNQDHDAWNADGIHDQDAAVWVGRLEPLCPFIVEHRHMIGIGQEAERLNHFRDLTARRLDCFLEILKRQRDLNPGVAGLETPVPF